MAPSWAPCFLYSTVHPVNCVNILDQLWSIIILLKNVWLQSLTLSSNGKTCNLPRKSQKQIYTHSPLKRHTSQNHIRCPQYLINL